MQLKLRVRWEKDEIFFHVRIEHFLLCYNNEKFEMGLSNHPREFYADNIKIETIQPENEQNSLEFSNCLYEYQTQKKHKYDLRQNLKNI